MTALVSHRYPVRSETGTLWIVTEWSDGTKSRCLALAGEVQKFSAVEFYPGNGLDAIPVGFHSAPEGG